MMLAAAVIGWLGCLGFSGCSGKSKGEKDQAAIKRLGPVNGHNYRDIRIRLAGSNLTAITRQKIQLEMWQGSSSRLGKGFSLEQVKIHNDSAAEAVAPAGVDPGRYRLVLRSGLTMRFTDLEFLVLTQKYNTGPPRILRVTPTRIRSDVPTRLTITGANLLRPISVALMGPLPDKDSVVSKYPTASRRWPYKRDRPWKLLRVRGRNPARISATVPPGFPEGTYAILIRTETHSGHRPDVDHVVTLERARPGISKRSLNFIIYFGIMGAIFIVGMILAWRQKYVGFSEPRQRRHLAWMLGGILFYVVLLGLLQFVFSGWY
jgi:hypothetical protein